MRDLRDIKKFLPRFIAPGYILFPAVIRVV